MAYTPTYTKPYEDGWKDEPDTTTPVTAEILNMLDATLEAVEDQLITEEERVDTLQALVEGMQNAIVFDTYAELETAIADETYTAELKVGQVFLIVETDVPDYWWTGTGLAELEGKVNLAGYVKKEELPTKVSELENDAGYVQDTRTIAGIDLVDDITAEELVEAERKVSGQIHVNFETAEETEGAIFPYMPYPTDENGNKLIGEAGQFYVANGDGTYYWLTIGNAEEGSY